MLNFQAFLYTVIHELSSINKNSISRVAVTNWPLKLLIRFLRLLPVGIYRELSYKQDERVYRVLCFNTFLKTILKMIEQIEQNVGEFCCLG